jgi:hypothetical protein
MSPVLQALNHGKSLLVWDPVVSLGRIHRLRHEADRMIAAVGPVFAIRPPVSVIRRIRFHMELFIRIRVYQGQGLD